MQGWKLFLIGICAMLLLCVAAIALCYATELSYFYCLTRENAWVAAKTETELDRRMWAFYTKRSISPADSMWGREDVLKPGERMVQYLVFGKEPLTWYWIVSPGSS